MKERPISAWEYCSVLKVLRTSRHLFALINYIESNFLLCLFFSSRIIVSVSVNLCDFRQVTIPRHADLVPRLQHLACHCDHERSVESGAQCLAGIINKLPDGKCPYVKC